MDIDFTKLATFGITKDNIDFIYALFPECTIINQDEMPFSKERKVYLYKKGINTQSTLYLDLTIDKRALNTKEGLLNMLDTLEIAYPQEFLNLEIDFFNTFLLFWHFQITPVCEVNQKHIFNIFKYLTTDFEKVYTNYKESGISYRVVFSSLLTFFNKSFGKASNAYYDTLLRQVNIHIQTISKQVIEYLWSNKTEIDFLRLLYNINRGCL